MEIIDTDLSGVYIITYDKKIDDRGTMDITFDYNLCAQKGIDFNCVQQRIYRAPLKNTFYGIHFQTKNSFLNKMIHCISGRGIDYVVDLKPTSPTFKKWIAIEINEYDNRHIYIPSGYGHAFFTLEDNTVQLFSIDEYFVKESFGTIRYDDLDIGLRFPASLKHMSDNDRYAPYLKEVIEI